MEGWGRELWGFEELRKEVWDGWEMVIMYFVRGGRSGCIIWDVVM